MIQVKNLAIAFRGQDIFEGVDFSMGKGEKVGLIGRNGSGKSTFLKLILNKLEPDIGEVKIPKGYQIGYLEQHIKFTEKTVIDEVCSVLPAEREYEGWKGETILYGLGFTYEELQKDPMQFSGGNQIKINLAKLLLLEPFMLLLDEPTNYLDIHSIKWLKEFLQEWRGELILITHDRDFMDSIITHTLIIHRNEFRKIAGNTSKIKEQIAVEEEMYEKTRLGEEKKRQKTEEWITRFKSKASKASSVQSRVKMLEKMGKDEKLVDIANINFEFNYADFSSKEFMLSANKVSFAYDENIPLIKNLSFAVTKGDIICIIGKNGKGKSTLLKLLYEELKANQGSVKKHEKTHIEYFGQMNIDRLDAKRSVYEEMQAVDLNKTETEVRKICGQMMFSDHLAHKKISILSGGEKSRVLIGKILLKPANLLFLDEPTNHLDMESCESLIAAINMFPGAVIMVTHDEGVLKEIATKLVVFDDDKTYLYEGTYPEFLKEKGWANP